MADLSDELKKKDLAAFHKDFSELIRVAYGIDLDYRKPRSNLDDYLPKFKSLVSKFSKKYPAVSFKIQKTPERIMLRIFLKEKDIKEILKTASKIAGLKSLGLGGFDEISVSDNAAISRLFEEIEDSVYLSYNGVNNENNTLVLKFDKKQKAVEIIYDFDTVSGRYNPEFKLIAYYSLKAGYKKDIDVHTMAAVFAFYEVLTEDEKNKALKRFNPPFLE